jgi:membrane-associated phospholipid phosphatase
MKILTVLLLLLTSSFSYGWGMQDFKAELVSPATTSAKWVLIGGTVLTTTFIIFEDSVSDPFQEKQVRNDFLGDASRYGDWWGQLVPNTLYIGGMSLAGQSQRALGMFKATAYSVGVTSVLKYTVREPRPNNIKEKNSFPSGHSTSAFAFSGYVAAEHGWGWGSLALLTSAFTAYSRINDNRHFLHDVVGGATIGWVYGWGMSRYQSGKAETSATYAPIVDGGTYGVAMVKNY